MNSRSCRAEAPSACTPVRVACGSGTLPPNPQEEPVIHSIRGLVLPLIALLTAVACAAATQWPLFWWAAGPLAALLVLGAYHNAHTRNY